MLAAVGVVKDLAGIDNDLAHEAPFREQTEGVVDRRLGYRQLTLLQDTEHLLGGKMLGSRQQDPGDLDPLRRRRDAGRVEDPGRALALGCGSRAGGVV